MSTFNYIWSPAIVRELDSNTTIDLTNPNLLKQEVYRVFNVTAVDIRVFFDGGTFTGIEYLCPDNDATTDDNNITDFVLPAYTSKAFIVNRWGVCLQVKD